ncbi:ubiquitin-specific protease [Thraustotheca clavata]|uniref:Ubiquitin-specific protease n=1 Tax=Thraustotheca clavata TaxID=74557 RepID=A0A1V9ZW36_9STRA|nr:ubiquitin-specific protease [Thraustotheca clavata]
MEPDSDTVLSPTSESEKRRRIQEDLQPAQLELYRVVYEDLRSKSTVGWQNAVNSFETASVHLEAPATVEFLQLCFRQILSIMLDQHASKIGPTEKNSVIQTLTKGTGICLAQLKAQQPIYLSHMALILNKKKLFYKEFRGSHMMGQYWNKANGCPEIRLQCIGLFQEHNGFLMLAQMLEAILDPVAFLGIVPMDDLRVLLIAATENRAAIDSGLIYRLSLAILQLVLALPAAELKKEATDIMGQMLGTITKHWDVHNPSPLHTTMLQVISRFIESTSLPQRLFGFEQLGHLVGSARQVQPYPLSYTVSGAGSPHVNGMYLLVRKENEPKSSTATYIKPSEIATTNPLTLFCCTMKSGSKWWFLSEADKIQPGTDQDIDYYQHQSTLEECLPPMFHWQPTGRGVAPAPLLVPTRVVETSIDPMRFDQQILNYVTKQKLLADIFGDRMHREIVARSTTLLTFMAESQAISEVGLLQIVGSTTGKEASLMAEIQTVLVTCVLPYVDDAMLVPFLEHVLASNLTDATLLMEKIAVSYRAILHRPHSSVRSAVSHVLWAIQLHSTKATSPELLDFFTDALAQTPTELARFVAECVNQLRASCSQRSVLALEEELQIARSLELLKFLLASSETIASVDELVSLLFDEITAFVTRNMISSPASEAALRHRLELMQFLHHTEATTLTYDQVLKLWNALRSHYADVFYEFLRESSVFVQHASDDAPLNMEVCLVIFERILCNASETAFSTLSVSGFTCFRTYFVGLNAHLQHLVKSPTGIRRILHFNSLRGLDALWTVTVEGLPEVSKLATHELLQVYANVDETERQDAWMHFLDHAFACLKHQDARPAAVHQCIQLLSGFVSSQPSTLVHGKRSRGAQLSLKCIVQRIPAHVHLEKTTITVNVFANDTISNLRALLEDTVAHPKTQTKLLSQGITLIGEGKTLSEVGLVDSSEIRVILFQTVVTKAAEDFASPAKPERVTPGSLLAAKEEYLDVLFALLDQPLSKQTLGLIRDLLLQVPTNSTWLQRCSTPLTQVNTVSSWLQQMPYHKAVYVLEILDGLLMPSSIANSVPENFVEAFVNFGIPDVLQFLFDVASEEHGTEVALRIVKFGCVEHHSVESMPIDTQEALVTHLTKLVLSQHSPRVLLDSLELIQATSTSSQWFVQVFSISLEQTLLHPCEPVRVQWLLTLKSHAKDTALLFPPLTAAIGQLSVSTTVCTELFMLLEHVLTPNVDMEPLVTYLLALLTPQTTPQVLLGSLRALTLVIRLQKRVTGKIWERVYDHCLFAMQSEGQRARSLCTTPETRRAAYSVLAHSVIHAPETQQHMMQKLGVLLSESSNPKKWGQECNVVARASGDHVGLKNQGCSCYMNSFLQQIFMYLPIRQGLLGAEIPSTYKTIEEDDDLSTLSPQSLVGRRIMHECGNGRSFEALITGYDAASQQHTVKYDDGGNDLPLQVLGNVHVTLLPPVLEGDDATVEVLRQVQRTFWYLKDSEMRYYNPKALVEACKCLNLEFSVYQQNDASEFCDKLLDRLETGLKKTPQGAGCLQAHLGGKLISQKLPQGCGHRYEREEAFIRLELQIRGKDSIQESLASFVEGEVMDGDNKVECELCATKKAAIRRTCFGALPNLLILHLKRFDLDYATFETVKLNNRCSFPLELDMKPYTKVGLEDDSSHDMEVDNSQYAYALRGVLVHSGVAQGGHYYSFILDQARNQWFKYDDEDVSPFDPANIEAECFGGTQKRTSSWNGVTNTMEMEVFSNALMLFYEKIVPTASPEPVVPVSPLANEVWLANDIFLKHSYVFDSEFHDFMKEIVSTTGTIEWYKLGLTFILDVVLHSREKKGLNRWLQLLVGAFTAHPELVQWLLKQCLGEKKQSWLVAYLFECPDTNARQTFANFLTRALVLAPATSSIEFCDAMVELWNIVLPLYVDEFFIVLRNLCEQSAVLRERLVQLQMCSRLVHFFLGTRSLPALQNAYPHSALSNAQMDFQALFETLSSIMGLPRRSPEPLLADATASPTNKITLSSKALDAFSQLFDEYAVDDHMGAKELQQYFGATIATAKITAKKIKGMLVENPFLDKSKFLEYYTELASTSTKQVLLDLKTHGFGENLQRQPKIDPSQLAPQYLSRLPPLCQHALCHPEFLESALEEEPEAICDVVVRVALGVEATSHVVISCILQQLAQAEIGWKGQSMVDVASIVFSQLLAVGSSALLELAFTQTPQSLLVASKDRYAATLHRAQQHPHTPLFLYRYLSLILELSKVESISQFLVQQRAEWSWMYQWLRIESLKPSLGGRAAILYRDPAKLEALLSLGTLLQIPYVPEEKSFVVSGAGFGLVNGVYSYQQQTHDDCLVFCCVSPIDNVEYTLFRCEMPSKAHRWYISHAANKQTLGTSSDEDFYYCPCTIHDDSPPEDGWKVWSKNTVAVAPVPTVRLHTSSIQMGNDIHATEYSVVPDMDMDDEEDETVEYEDSEDEIRVSNERFQAVHLESPDTTGNM